MLLPGQKFLGDNRIVRPVGDSSIILTAYNGDTCYEQWHSHENASLSFLLSGTHGEDLCAKHYKRVPGEVKFIVAGQAHRCNGYSTTAKKLNLDFGQSLLKGLELNEDNIFALLEDSRHLKFTFLKLYQELDDSCSHSTVSAEILLYQLLQPPALTLKCRSAKPPAWALRLKEILHDRWNDTFELEELALQLGVHPVTISKYFPRYFGETLGGYMRAVKIEKALVMIRANATLSLTEVAYACGFADQAHFTRTFKTCTGVLPKFFRNI